MKRLASVTIVLLGLTISCAPTVTHQPQLAVVTKVVTPTPQVVIITATPEPTNTLTNTPTITPTATRTSTPTITTTTTQTPIAKFVWTLKGALVGFDGNMKKGGTTAIVPDPTGSGRGLVQRSAIGPDGNPPEDETPGALVYRLYPAIYESFKPAPCEVKEDIWASKDLVETATTARNYLGIGPDIFDKHPGDGGKWSSALQAVLDSGSIFRGKAYLRLRSFDETNRGITAPRDPNAPEFTPEQWHTVSIYIETNRDVMLYQDGQLVSKGTLPLHNRVGLVGGHTGIYAYHWYQSSPPIKGFLLVDNWEIRCW